MVKTVRCKAWNRSTKAHEDCIVEVHIDFDRLLSVTGGKVTRALGNVGGVTTLADGAIRILAAASRGTPT